MRKSGKLSIKIDKRACTSIRYCRLVLFDTLKPQIREQMSGPDLHVFTLKFLAQTLLFHSPVQPRTQPTAQN